MYSYVFDLFLSIHVYIYQIVQCRKLLYELSGTQGDQEPPSIKPDGWKKACSSVLALTVSKCNEEHTNMYISYSHLINKL